MKYKLLISLIILFTAISAFCILGESHAQTPCSYQGHRSIAEMRACLGAYSSVSSNARYLNNHHIQMVSGLSRNSMIPPHSYPYAGNDSFYTTAVVAAPMLRAHYGYYGKTLVYPFIGGYGAYPYGGLPTDIVTYLQK